MSVCKRESVGIGVVFCWCQLARGLQINVRACADAYVRGANKGALTNTRKQISSSAEKQKG